jgi:hypothetical protein
MRAFAIKMIAAAVSCATCASIASADMTNNHTLTGKMAEMNYLVGTWSCTTKVAHIGKTPASTVAAKNVYWIEPQNVVGSHYTSGPYSASGYTGWLASKKLWWSDDADVYNAVSSETGKDSGTNVQVMTGTAWTNGGAYVGRDTITKISNTSYTDLFELAQGGKVVFRGISSCTKTSSSSM